MNMKQLAITLSAILLLSGCQTEVKREVSKVTGKEILNVGMECNYAPYAYVTNQQSETSVAIGDAGFCDGYDVMIARRIAEELQMEIRIRSLDVQAFFPSLEEGSIDLVIAGMSATQDREKEVDFTTPYYKTNMVMLVNKNSETSTYTNIQQFTEKKLAGQSGTLYDTLIDQIQGVQHMESKATYAELITALQEKQLDAILADQAVATYVTKNYSDLAMVSFADGSGFDIDANVSIALPEGSRDSDFFQKVQAAIDTISEEEQNKMMEEAIAQ